jgi:ABC-type transport system involved in multi-copper enzyme maturation permease subunit
MSALSAVHATASPGRLGFAGALRGELVLTRRRIAVWVSLAVWALCIAIFAYLVSYVSTVGAEWYTPEQQRMFVDAMLPAGTSYYVLASLPLYGAPQFAILGAILGSSDYTRGTIRTIMSRFPNRTPFITARLTNLVIVSALAAIVTLLTSILSSIAVAMASGRETEFPPLADLTATALGVWLVAVAFISIGFALGTVTRSMIAAVAVAIGWVLGVESLLVSMLAPVIPALEAVQGFLPVGATSSLAAGFLPADQQTVPAIVATTTPGAAVVVLLVWTALACTVSFILTRRRDLA